MKKTSKKQKQKAFDIYRNYILCKQLKFISFISLVKISSWSTKSLQNMQPKVLWCVDTKSEHLGMIQ